MAVRAALGLPMLATTEGLAVSTGVLNEGSGDFADGLSADPSLKTHAENLNIAEQPTSRAEQLLLGWRRKIAAVMAVCAFVGPVAPLAGCSRDMPERAPSAGADAPGRAGGGELIGNQNCYIEFHKLTPTAQEECRIEMAALSNEEVDRLSPLDQARWANYYMHVALGKTTILEQDIVRTKTIETKDAKYVGESLVQNYQLNMYRLAWLLKNRPTLGNDDRTIRALCGIQTTKESDTYKTAFELSKHIPDAMGQTDYLNTVAGPKLFFNPDVSVQNKNGVYVLSAKTKAITIVLPNSDQSATSTYTFTLYPYYSVQRDPATHVYKEMPDLDDEAGKIIAAAGKPLLPILTSIS